MNQDGGAEFKLTFWALGFRFRVHDLGFRVQRLGFRVWHAGFRVEDLGFRVCQFRFYGFGLQKINKGVTQGLGYGPIKGLHRGSVWGYPRPKSLYHHLLSGSSFTSSG